MKGVAIFMYMYIYIYIYIVFLLDDKVIQIPDKYWDYRID